MKLVNSFYRASMRNALAIILAIACVPILSSAQQQSVPVIADHSTASLFLGTPENPTSLNVGIARVSGEVSASQFDLTIYAANQYTTASVQPVITFHSEDVKQGADGTLEVRGRLTVTQAQQEVSANPGENYSGVVFGPVTLLRTSHQATFIVAAAKTPVAATEDARVVPVQLTQPESGMVLTATAKVNGEAFPELAHSIQKAQWPLVVDDQKCAAPATAGEDYSGITCTGKVHEPSPTPVLLVQPGEAYTGMQQAPPAGDQVTIQLNLRLANANGASLASQIHTDGGDKARTDSQPQAQ